MRCPHCESLEDKVLESRTMFNGDVIRRRRECLSCGYRFTSYERIEEKQFMVIKKAKESREISTTELGEIVLEKLYSIDKVAYIRFVSVYRHFENLDEFIKEAKKINKKEKTSDL